MIERAITPTRPCPTDRAPLPTTTAPGHLTDPDAPQHAIPCAPPGACVWGEVVMDFSFVPPEP